MSVCVGVWDKAFVERKCGSIWDDWKVVCVVGMVCVCVCGCVTVRLWWWANSMCVFANQIKLVNLGVWLFVSVYLEEVGIVTVCVSVRLAHTGDVFDLCVLACPFVIGHLCVCLSDLDVSYSEVKMSR